tara:strand:+ start:431 stop:883 length:453 start_codon:yes stop_codon:yes gene_type:complete
MPIKSFRGKLADGGIERVFLHTNTGSTGYRIKKFQIMPVNPAGDVFEATVKIYKIPQTTTSNTIDFEDQTLLAAGYLETHDDPSSAFSNYTDAVVFDNEIFNQDIYITFKDGGGAANSGINYYFELEQIKLDLTENTVATLKDIRNINPV